MTQTSSRTLAVAIVALGLATAACGSQDQPATATTEQAASVSVPSSPALVAFDPATLPVSSAELGDTFPYMSVPQGYVARSGKTLEVERKYLFPGGALRIVEGLYYHADVFVDAGDWTETALLSQLDRQLVALGAVQVFDGGLPEAVAERLRADEPASAKDLYDPWPYRFRQYAIRTATKLIWVEIGYGYNAEMIDLTVIEEPLPPTGD